MVHKATAITVILLLTVALVAFAAGGAEPASTGPKQVTFYLWDDPTYEQLVDGYNAAHTDIQIAAEYIPASEYETKLITLLAGGTDMDAYMQKRSTDIFTQYANGNILPLDDLIASTGYDFDALSGYAEAVTVDGKVLALPFRGSSYYTYYNKKLFDAAGEPYPTSYVEKGEWTWDKFAEVARRLTSDDVTGSLLYTWGSQQVMPALQDGVEFITQDGKIDLNDTVEYSLRLRKSGEGRRDDVAHRAQGDPDPLLDGILCRRSGDAGNR
jgi:multiple sugar transport system substrate-binding protein